jgi:uncharacterized protein (DUF2236 family)
MTLGEAYARYCERGGNRTFMTLGEAYARYCERGGNRTLDPKVLEYLGDVAAATIDRDFLLEWGRKLYPKLTPAQRVQRFAEPLAEILGLPPAKPGSVAYWAERKLERDAENASAIERQYGRLLKICEADRAREAAERVAADGREADAERYWKRYEAIQKELGVSNRRSPRRLRLGGD